MNRTRLMGYCLASAALAAAASGVWAAGTPAWTNIRVSPACDGQSYECMLAIDPVQPWKMAVGANDETGTTCGAMVGSAGAFFSTDAGNTWAKSAYSTSIAGSPIGDQAFALDLTGHLVSCAILDNGCSGGTGMCAIASFGSPNSGPPS